MLRTRCAGEPRLRWRSLPWPCKVEHGQALNFLFTASNEPYFCFMDSDILATGDFMAELLPAMSGAAGLFSAWPITIKAEERMLSDVCSFIGGRHSHTTAGLCLGGSYFAMYERAALAQALAAAPDGFNRGYWAQLPQRTRQFLRKIGQERRFYDTGRVLNLCLQRQGGALRVHDTTALLHLGSYSIYAGSAQHTVPRWKRLAQAVLRRVRNRLNGQTYRDAVLHQVAQDPVQRSVDQRRQQLAAYFARVADALAADEALTLPPALLDVEIEDQVARAVEVLATILGK
ncbi:glycosyltransferase [Candidatus Chloroploca sp. M-50]|uniref:Glycosyltransferase n=1 Tax=Candidatus Chloroploca mongolica TaxID=2528176 RepID=A0ABS4D472_9CHLR|nr:glycosyltransferase [Candidatus Chloroploca mongolica]MBP1464226.1 glycosyltransferase [Candidatus Chloroploca mongolica]